MCKLHYFYHTCGCISQHPIGCEPDKDRFSRFSMFHCESLAVKNYRLQHTCGPQGICMKALSNVAKEQQLLGGASLGTKGLPVGHRFLPGLSSGPRMIANTATSVRGQGGQTTYYPIHQQQQFQQPSLYHQAQQQLYQQHRMGASVGSDYTSPSMVLSGSSQLSVNYKPPVKRRQPARPKRQPRIVEGLPVDEKPIKDIWSDDSSSLTSLVDSSSEEDTKTKRNKQKRTWKSDKAAPKRKRATQNKSKEEIGNDEHSEPVATEPVRRSRRSLGKVVNYAEDDGEEEEDGMTPIKRQRIDSARVDDD